LDEEREIYQRNEFLNNRVKKVRKKKMLLMEEELEVFSLKHVEYWKESLKYQPS